MRILFVTNNYTPYSGGVVSSIQSTLQQLQVQGHHVRIVTLDFLGNAHQDPEYVYRIPSVFRFKHKYNHIVVPWRMRSFLKKQCNTFNPDVIHVHHPFLLGVVAARVAHSLKIPLIFTYHTVYEAYAHYVPLPQKVMRPLIKKRAINFCNTVSSVIAPSDAIAQDILQAGVLSPVTVIPSGIRECFITSSFAPKNKKKHEPCNLISVGRFTPEKNIDMVIDLFAQLPQDGTFTLTLVGYGALEQKLRKQAFEKYKFSPELVKFIIKPPQDELIALYRNADIFVFTSTTDTQGLVLAESMSQGTPVVALDGPGQRGIIKNGENGFIVNNLYAMKEAVLRIAHDTVLHQKLQHGAWQTAKEYNPVFCVQKLFLLYEKNIRDNGIL